MPTDEQKQRYVTARLEDMRIRARSSKEVYDAQALNVGHDIAKGSDIELVDRVAFAKMALKAEMSEENLKLMERVLQYLGFDTNEKQ